MARRYVRKTCPKCGGCGEINLMRSKYLVKYLVPITTAGNVNFYTTCDKCNGKGWVETNLFIEEE